ncbi:hypothetical protein [Clostridium novyi]|uniref:hypothetical protein n=1 Tax=Clostridium novyi TaxID=1542 RepID=UPI000A9FC0AA|nr:hypothetical protein [Clostridium novyi]
MELESNTTSGDGVQLVFLVNNLVCIGGKIIDDKSISISAKLNFLINFLILKLLSSY